jgi:aminoglycoside phosphotransferase (APT) family kinase protein
LERAGGDECDSLHNDLHWKQFRFKDDRVAVLDLERMCSGDALVDAANLATQLRMLGLRPETGVEPSTAQCWAGEFEEAWRRVARRPIDPIRWQAYSMVSLLELARGMMRHLRPGWRALAARCVQSAEGGLT